MTNEIVKRLEHAALDAHAAGWTWLQFWQEHGEKMRKAEPINARRYHRLADHLLALVVSGNADGHVPIDDDVMPWEADDALVEVSDTHTEAKLQPGFLFDARPEYR
ncbi:MAG: hypothetical protein NTW96_24805 [Planctomycetia bacterium]|nr:hypothetical protein [Planctomycetia bacterium]